MSSPRVASCSRGVVTVPGASVRQVAATGSFCLIGGLEPWWFGGVCNFPGNPHFFGFWEQAQEVSTSTLREVLLRLPGANWWCGL